MRLLLALSLWAAGCNPNEASMVVLKPGEYIQAVTVYEGCPATLYLVVCNDDDCKDLYFTVKSDLAVEPLDNSI